MRKYFLFLTLFFSFSAVRSQHLKAGFDKAEGLELLKIGGTFGDSVYAANLPLPEHSRRIYRSPSLGLDNLWELWVNDDSVAIISVRGTANNSVSWLENFYAAMVPAKGRLQLSETDTFDYTLAVNPTAAVHAGWLIGMAFLSEDILPRIDSCYRAGLRSFIITGHSQGGGINYLLTSYLYNLQKQGRIPEDIRFKTYAFAAPKPGNQYYANEYEAMTGTGWAFNVINSADWVPEVPVSIQTLNDFNTINPFSQAGNLIRKQKFPARLIMRHIYGRLNKPAKKVQKYYQRYLGKKISKYVVKNLPGFTVPAYYQSSNYVRTGTPVTLLTDEAYYRLFPDDPAHPFRHHHHRAYLYLLEKYPI